MSACWPKNGRVPEPGFRSTHGSGVIMNMPVSVCHHVSMMGQRSLPMYLKYQRHASGLIGSPTDPSSRNDDRSRRFGHASPNRIRPRMAVGAVYRTLMPYLSTIAHHRSGYGNVGAPSYMKLVAPRIRGPYTMYEWPVTQPGSAAHHQRSSSFRSNTYFSVVATPTW